MSLESVTKNIWYPGSAYASQAWIEYLIKIYRGKWFFSDIHNNWAWDIDKRNVRLTFDTLENPNPSFLNDKALNALILSRHSGLRTFEEIFESQILQFNKPLNFIYDPGTNNGDINQHLSEIQLFENIGYKLIKIVVLPHLHHQYCEYKLDMLPAIT